MLRQLLRYRATLRTRTMLRRMFIEKEEIFAAVSQ